MSKIDLSQPSLLRGAVDGVLLGALEPRADRMAGSEDASDSAPIAKRIAIQGGLSVAYDLWLAQYVEPGMGEYGAAAAKGAAIAALDLLADFYWYRSRRPLGAMAAKIAVGAAVLPAGRLVGDTVPPLIGMPPIFSGAGGNLQALANQGAGATTAAVAANAAQYPLSSK